MNNLIENVSCPLCNNGSPELLTSKGMYGFPTNVCICPNDGMVFLSPRWNKKRYEKFYSYEFDKYHRGQEEEYNPICERQQKYSDEIYNRLRQAKKDIKELMEIGPGSGWVLEFLRQKMNLRQIHVIEPSLHWSKYLKERGYKSFCQDAEQNWADSDRSSYDVIIMRHVFEHFFNPQKALKEIRLALKKDGIIYLEVPNMMRPRGSASNYWFRAVHTYYFSFYTLNKMFYLKGFTCSDSGTYENSIWAIFKKTEKEPYPFNSKLDKNNYKKQKRIIKKLLFFDKFYFLQRKKILNLLPQKIKKNLRQLIDSNKKA